MTVGRQISSCETVSFLRLNFTDETTNFLVCFGCSLSELEMTRDDLLIQLYQSSEAFVDKNTVEFSTYFVVN